MCEICNIEKGDCELLMYEPIEVKVGGRVMTDHNMSTFISRKDDGTYEILSSYFMDEAGPVAEIHMPINYCPICGRE